MFFRNDNQKERIAMKRSVEDNERRRINIRLWRGTTDGNVNLVRVISRESGYEKKFPKRDE